MNRRIARLLVVSLASLTGQMAFAEGRFSTPDGSREAYSHMVPDLPASQLTMALRGRSLFRQSWVIPPARDTDIAGLGPLYNQIACQSCHPKNGRGKAPENPQQAMRSMLIRLSMPGEDPQGGPLPHPVYGNQFNEQGAPGVPGEGRVSVSYRERPIHFADGETVTLREPIYVFTELNYGPMPPAILLSPRVGPMVFGLGLLEAVPASELLKLAEAGRKQGINGRPNRVWDAERQTEAIGRFGLKANVATLKQQIAGAFIGDLGITSSLHPQENCSPRQTACRNAPSTRTPELDDSQLDALLLYLRLLQVPARRNIDDPEVKLGEKRFTDIGCAACHVSTLSTGEFTELPMLAHQTFHPYTDLLLHDMGDGLADGRPDYQAGGRDWRTPPLWGIGLVETINEHTEFLHDGRARNLTEAVLWHGGEALPSQQRFIRLPKAERLALLRFLASL